jgi:hypothetical protein
LAYATEAAVIFELGLEATPTKGPFTTAKIALAIARSDRQIDRWDTAAQARGQSAATNADKVDASNLYCTGYLLRTNVNRNIPGITDSGVNGLPAKLPNKQTWQDLFKEAADIMKVPPGGLRFAPRMIIETGDPRNLTDTLFTEDNT